MAGVEKGALADTVDGMEGAPDLVVEASMGGVIAREVEEHRGQGCGCCVASCVHIPIRLFSHQPDAKRSLTGSDHQMRLSPNLGLGELCASLGVCCREQSRHDIVPLTNLLLGRHTFLRKSCRNLKEPLPLGRHMWEYPFIRVVPSAGVDVEERGKSEAQIDTTIAAHDGIDEPAKVGRGEEVEWLAVCQVGNDV